MEIHGIDYFLSRNKLTRVLDRLDVTPRKKHGQNFFISKPTISRIIELCDFDPGETVLEIGPGLGALTMNIASKVKKLVAIELNPSFTSYLEKKMNELSISNTEIITGDALKLQFPGQINKIISAMPYAISAPLVFKILEYMGKNKTKAFLVSQREFARKIVAMPGTKDYSRISINTSLFATVKILMEISRNNFYPIPKVDSSFMVLVSKPSTLEREAGSLLKLTRGLFPYKNKTVGRALKIYFKNFLEAKLGQAILGKFPFKDKRVRDLDEQDLLDLVSWFQENKIAIK